MRWLAAAVMCVLAGTLSAQERISLTRVDGAKIPVLEFSPQGTGCAPVLIVSHGLGGDENGHKVLAVKASQAGFRVLTMGHWESGRAALRTALRAENRRAALTAAVSDRKVNTARMWDLDAAWTYATKRCQPPFSALAGHSMGAGLTIMEAGARNKLGVTGKKRFDAYVALSPQGVGTRFSAGAWRGINAPVLMVTGTRDNGLDGGWKNRLTAFAGLPEGHKYLALLKGATHFDVGGSNRSKRQDQVHKIILAFLVHNGRPGEAALPRFGFVTYRAK